MTPNQECKIGIGDVSLAISCNDLNFMNHFRYTYQHCLTDKAPDFSVTIEVHDTITRNDIQKSLDEYRTQEHPITDGAFSWYDNLISGTIHEGKKSCDLKVELAVIASEYLALFQDFIFKDLFYYVVKRTHGNGHKRPFIIHGCGVVHKEEGFLFLGRSGCGKSTIARLSKKDTILHDEAVLVSPNHDHYMIESTPYISDVTNLFNTKKPLKAGFFLRQGKTNKITVLPQSEMVHQFIKQMVAPSGTRPLAQGELLNEMLAFSCDLVRAVPFFELTFSAHDDSFWQEIENRLPASPKHGENQEVRSTQRRSF